jgi:hypothetical protein
MDAWRVLNCCVEVNRLNLHKDGFDSLFYTRKGVKPQFLFKWWEEINAEIDASDTLS